MSDPQPAATGPQLWAELHARPLAYARNAAAELLWLTALADRLPFSCDCRKHWLDYLAASPPMLLTAAEYAQWTFSAHAAVNVRLGKPGVTLAHAATMHGWTTLSGFVAARRAVVET